MSEGGRHVSDDRRAVAGSRRWAMSRPELPPVLHGHSKTTWLVAGSLIGRLKDCRRRAGNWLRGKVEFASRSACTLVEGRGEIAGVREIQQEAEAGCRVARAEARGVGG